MRANVVRKNDKWYVVVSETDPLSHRRKQVWEPVGREADGYTKADAEKRKRALEVAADQGQEVLLSKNKTVAMAVEGWLTAAELRLGDGRTLAGYRQKVIYILESQFAGTRIDKIQPNDVEAFYKKLMQRGLSAQSVRTVHVILKSIFNYAANQNWLLRNPARGAAIPRLDPFEARALTADELERLLEASRSATIYPIIALAALTGMRRGEILGLQWRDIDWDARTATVARTLNFTDKKGTYFSTPKTDRSRRVVSLSERALSGLRALRERLEAQQDDLTGKSTLLLDSLLFRHVDGSPLLPNSVSRAFMRIVRRIGLDGVRFHDLRHTHATLLLQNGATMNTVSRRLGHSTAAFTLTRYGHTLPGDDQRAADQLDAILEGANESANKDKGVTSKSR